MFTIKDFKNFIEQNNLPDDMPIQLLDVSTDDETEMNYSIAHRDLDVADWYHEDDRGTDDYGKPRGKMLYIQFVNKLNENPID